MELIIALVLFVGLIACWVVLPGSIETTVKHAEPERVTATTAQSA